MKEDTVRSIMAYYFKQKHIKAIPQKAHASGPDFLHRGAAIEVKGSKFPFERAIQQFIEYLFTGKYKGLSVAFPHDFLDAGKLDAFYVFCDMAENIRVGTDKHKALYKVPTYLVTEDDKFYYVKKENGHSLRDFVYLEFSYRYARLAISKTQTEYTRIIKSAFPQFDDFIQLILQQYVKRKPTTKIPKTEINHTTSQTHPTPKSPP